MKLQFHLKEFQGMIYDPTRLQEGDSVFKIFPDLKKYKIFQKSAGPKIDNNKLMQWIFLCYDKNTPYRVKYKDVLKRKIEIAHDVEFQVQDSGVFEDPIEDFLKGRNDIVNMKIVEFVRMHRSFKYSYFVGIENSYYNIMLDVVNGATKRINELKQIQEELEETLIQMLNDDDNPHTRETVLRYMEEDRILLRPEDIALKLSRNEQPITHKEIL